MDNNKQSHAHQQYNTNNNSNDQINIIEDALEADEWTFINKTLEQETQQSNEDNASDSDSIAIIDENPPPNDDQSSGEDGDNSTFTESIPERIQSEEKYELTYDISDSSSCGTIRECEEQLPENFCFKEEKVRSYIHRRNNRLSSLLNVILLGTVITTAGIAIGHMWGINDDCSIDMKNSISKILINMQKLQEENEYLRSQIKVLKMNQNLSKGSDVQLEPVINLNVIPDFDHLTDPYELEFPIYIDETPSKHINEADSLQCWEEITLSGTTSIGPKTGCNNLQNDVIEDNQNQTKPVEIIPESRKPKTISKKVKRETKNKETKKEKHLKYVKMPNLANTQKINEYDKKYMRDEAHKRNRASSEWYLKMGKARRQILENIYDDNDGPKNNRRPQFYRFANLNDKAKWYFKRMDDREKKRNYDEYKWSVNKKIFNNNFRSKW